jgi:hypothetical protein
MAGADQYDVRDFSAVAKIGPYIKANDGTCHQVNNRN